MLSDTRPESKRKVRRRLFASDLTNEIDYLMDQQYRLDRERMLTLWSFDIESSQFIDNATFVTQSAAAAAVATVTPSKEKSLTETPAKTNSPLDPQQQQQQQQQSPLPLSPLQQSLSVPLVKNSPNPLKKRPFVSSNKENLRTRIRDGGDFKKWRRKLTF